MRKQTLGGTTYDKSCKTCKHQYQNAFEHNSPCRWCCQFVNWEPKSDE